MADMARGIELVEATPGEFPPGAVAFRLRCKYQHGPAQAFQAHEGEDPSAAHYRMMREHCQRIGHPEAWRQAADDGRAKP